MIKYIVKRIANYIVMLFVAISLTYFLASAFLNPRSTYMERHPRPPMASIENALTLANVNDKTPVIQRYFTWLKNIVFHWNWGLAPDKSSVNAALAPRIAASLQLVIIATILGILIGVSLGVYTAIKQYKWQDRVLSSIGSFFLTLPTTVLALAVVFAAIYFNAGVGSRVFFVTGLHSYDGTNPLKWLLDFLQHLILPTIVLAIPTIVGYQFPQRTYLLDTMNADYVRTARAKGLTLNKAIRKHALRTSLIPTAQSVAFSIAGVFTGATLTETIFAVNGLGRYFVTTLSNQDINGSVAIAAFSGVCTLAGALLADIFAAWIDPRIRLS
ncbi:ABC transporter permease [Alloscardovia venturai]|uniref:ABC transporter permease n=1 Tax=Alloscardovia venturai TaxID=1769421 RepID=A0ABW2Y758_9BIFI